MMAFIAGFVIGGMFGAVTMALCTVGGNSPRAGHVIVADEEKRLDLIAMYVDSMSEDA